MANIFGPTFGEELHAAAVAAALSLDGVSADLITGTVYFNGVPVASSTAPSALKTVAANVIAAHDNTKADRTAAAAVAFAAGITISSTSTPSLNGHYGTSMQDDINYLGIQSAIEGGQPWPGYIRDTSNVKHTMTGAQATAMLEAILTYIAAIDAYVAGDTASLPAATATIA